MASPMIYVARKKIKVGDEVRLPGDQVPEAENWLRVDSWEHTGFLVRVPGEYTKETMISKPKPKAAPKPVAKKKPGRPRKPLAV